MTLLAFSALLLAQADDAPPKTLSLAVVPVGFSDRSVGNLGPLYTKTLPAWFDRVSNGRFTLKTELLDPARLGVARASFRDRHLEPLARGLDRDHVIFVLAGPLGRRGSSLWPHENRFTFGRRVVRYVVLVEDAGDRALGIAAHEISHLLGLDDKYDDPRSEVGRWCLMGTGYDAKDPAPPCADCRVRLGWENRWVVDSRRTSDVEVSRAAWIRTSRGDGEYLVLEMRERLLAWHVQGGGRITLLGVYPDGDRDRITPYSDPPFRARSIGSWPVWVTDIRIRDGKARFRLGPSGEPTDAERKRRASAARAIGK